MKLSISTFKIICSLYNYPEEVLEDKEYLDRSLVLIDNLSYSLKEKQTAIKEITKLIETL